MNSPLHQYSSLIISQVKWYWPQIEQLSADWEDKRTLWRHIARSVAIVLSVDHMSNEWNWTEDWVVWGGYNLPRDSCRKKLCEASQEKRIGMCCAAVIPGVQLTGTDLSPPPRHPRYRPAQRIADYDVLCRSFSLNSDSQGCLKVFVYKNFGPHYF